MAAPIVLDASFCLPWFYEDEATKEVLALRDKVMAGRSDLLVPAVWPLEMLNSFTVAFRRKRISEAQYTGYTHILGQLRQIEVIAQGPEDYTAIQHLAGTYKLSAYDAAYLHLTLQHSAKLASFDEALRKAAGLEKLAVIPA